MWKHIALGLFAAVCMVMLSNVTVMAAEEYTCECNGVKYTSLVSAIKSVKEGQTVKIKMISDETMSGNVALAVEATVSLDLAGFHVNLPDCKQYNGLELIRGTFILDDSVGTGTFSVGNESLGMIYVRGATFIMNGGTFVHNENPALNEKAIYGVGGKIIINGGTFQTRFPFQLYGKSKRLSIEINGGEFVGEVNSLISGDVEGVIRGGKFSAPQDTKALMIALTPYNSLVPKIKISGGEYESQTAGIAIYYTDFYKNYEYGIADIMEEGYWLSDSTLTNPRSYAICTANNVKVLPLLSDKNVTISDIKNVTYTGSYFTPVKKIVYNGTTLKEGTDYVVQYTNNLNTGTATVKIAFQGDYTGTITKTFIIDKVKLSDENVSVTGIENVTYTGSRIVQTIKAVYNKTVLKEGTDYVVQYTNNLNAGTATVKIVFQGNYTGTITKTFNIIAKITDQNVSVTGIKNVTYKGSRILQTIMVVYDKKIVLKEGTDYTVRYTNNLNVGTATVTITFKGYYTGTVAKTFKITKASQKISLTHSSYVKATASKFSLGAKLVTGNGKLSYSSSNSTIATVNEKGMVSLTGKYGFVIISVKSNSTNNYLAEKRTVKITVKPKQMQKPSLTLKGAGKVQVKWSVDKNASGYEVKYATNSEFKGPKTKLITGASQYSTTLSGLTKGKTYYVKIRAYKTINGEKVYGQYSNVVKILIK